jgi:hypothetical protein
MSFLNKALISYINLTPKSVDLYPQAWPLVKDAFYDKKGSYRELSDRP